MCACVCGGRGTARHVTHTHTPLHHHHHHHAAPTPQPPSVGVGAGMRGPRRRRWLGEEEEEEEEENTTASPQAPAPTAPQPCHSGGNCRGRVVRWVGVAVALLWVLCVVRGAEGYGRYLTSAGRPSCKTVPSWGRWPENVTDLDDDYIFVGFLPTRRGTRRERLGIKIPGAFTYSAKKVNDDGILPENYKLRYEFFDTGGEEVNGSSIMVELLCRNVSAVFGPEHTCFVEGTIAQGKNLPLISYGCTDEKASKFTTFVRTNPSEIYIIRTAVAAMKHNNWTRFSVIYDKDQVSTKDTLVREAQNSNMTVNHVDEYDKERLYLIFDRTKNATRIYVYVGHRNLVNQILSVMSMNGMFPPGPGPKEYLLLYIEEEEYNTGDWLAYIWGDEANAEQECRKNDLLSFDQAFMVVANRKPESSDLSQMVRRYNMRPPFCLGHKDNVTRSDRPRERRSGAVGLKHVPYLPSAHLYDSVQLYAAVVAELYEELKGTNVTVRDIARNGKLIKDKMRNRTYESILGFSMTMNDNGTSEGKYSVYLFSDCPSDTLSNCPLCLHKISDYHSENRSLDASAIRLKILDEPVCGYDGMKCDTGQHYQKQIAWVLGSILVLCLFISTILYRNWKYEQEIVGLQWRINQSDLIMSTNHVAAGSRQSLVSAYSFDLHGEWFQNLAKYKGVVVCVKLIPLNQRRSELSRNTMKEMRNMREMKQDNVCAFIGAYVEHSKVALVSEYSPRGSLLDILGLEDMKLDSLFISSLIHDLLRGMIFLHSHFGPHGNLKSSNCVVNSRWVLQITDYGLQDLRCETLKQLERDDQVQFHRQMLWRAPEQLREGIDALWTKEADVYSFGIILHEVIGRQGPYGMYDGIANDNATDIISKVRAGSTEAGSPYRPDLNKIVDMPFGSNSFVRNAMQMCWSESPADRPSFKAVKLKIKCMKDKCKRGNLMDHMMQMMEQYSKNLEELVANRTQALRDEEKRTKDLLHRMLPSSVAASLAQGIAVEPQGFDAVTIYFSDIVGFTSLSAESTPYEVVTFLNDLYTLFDKIIRGYDVYKVETIGDAYMVVSGLPKPNSGRHAGEIASMALELLDGVQNKFVITHRPEKKLLLRVGLHTGPVIAGVVGLTMPRYCLFGDTVNTASRMESNGEPLRIHISQTCRNALEKLGGYLTEKRGLVPMKGKGEVLTYWLNGATEEAIQRREVSELLPPLLQQSDADVVGEVRRRSPRLSSLGNRTSSVRRSVEEPGDLNGGLGLLGEEARDSPRSEVFRRRRLSHNFRTASIDNTQRGSLLCPPVASPVSALIAAETVPQSISLDCLNQSGMRLEVPALQNTTAAASPSSSEPTLPMEDKRGVNFCPSARAGGTNFPAQGNGEREPMLGGENREEPWEEDVGTRGESSPISHTQAGKPASFKALLAGFLPHSKPASKFINGLRRENLV